jgi:tetratricopeptide (TPR) repeat protein
VLQNLAFERAPVWHYAVVVGFNAEQNRMILRSGAQRRRLERPNRFLRSWRLADNWGFVAVRPGEIPASTTPDAYLRAVVGAHRMLGDAGSAASDRAALERWPNDPLVLFFAATHEQSTGQLASAGKLYRRVLAAEPSHPAARNNLATALLAQGCRTEALREARLALSQQQADDSFNAAIADTMREIEASPDQGQEPAFCSAG